MENTLINRKTGFTMIENCVLRNPYISKNARFIYGVLLSYSFGKDTCFPGHERIAEEVGISVSHVRNALRELKGCGLITWKQRGLNKPNIYYIEEIPLTVKKEYSKLQFNLALKFANPEEHKEDKDEKKVLKMIHKLHEQDGRKFKKVVKCE